MKTLIFTLLMLTTNLAYAKVCFEKRLINNFETITFTELHIFTSDKGEYKLTITPCFNIGFANHIDFQTWPLNSNVVCDHDQVIVPDIDGKSSEYCAIDSIEKIK